MEQKYAEYAVQKAAELLAIDSPTGFTDQAAAWVLDTFGALGFDAKKTAKGGVLVDLGGDASDEGALLLQAHTDTLGAMVAEVKANGRLRVTNLGGMRAENGETENVRVYTRAGKVYEGTLQLCNASVHVNGDYGKTDRTFDTTEILLDETVSSAEETRALGIETGDIVCFDPRTRVTASGYIKSRFLDDKLSVGILLGFAKYLRDEGKQLQRRTFVHVTVYEEVGHGGAASVPAGVTESISVDMGCVGDGLACTERQVSICAKDSGGPYSYEVVGDGFVATVMSNIGLHKYCAAHHMRLLCAAVGDRNVLELMQKEGMRLGGEQSGHIIFLDYMPTGDGQLAALQFLKILSHSGKKASELSDSVTQYPQLLKNVRVTSNDQKTAIMQAPALHEAIRAAEEELGENGRVLIRPSGTEPLIRVMVEAGTEQQAQVITDRLVQNVENLQKSL